MLSAAYSGIFQATGLLDTARAGIARMSETLAEDEAFLASLAEEKLALWGEAIPGAELCAVPRPVARRALARWLGGELSRERFDALLRFAAGDGDGAVIAAGAVHAAVLVAVGLELLETGIPVHIFAALVVAAGAAHALRVEGDPGPGVGHRTFFAVTHKNTPYIYILYFVVVP